MKMETVKTIGMCARPCNVFSFRLLRKYKLWRDRKDSEEDIDFYAMYYVSEKQNYLFICKSRAF
jgi:hypothetical protein